MTLSQVAIGLLALYGFVAASQDLTRVLFRDRPRRCAATDGEHGHCTDHAGHYGAVHREMRDGKLWAEWRSVVPEDEPLNAQTCGCQECHTRATIDMLGYIRPPF